MIVSRSTFEEFLEELKTAKVLSLDTETTGLLPYHGNRLFSMALATSSERAFYFNWQKYEGLYPGFLLEKNHLDLLKTQLFDTFMGTYFIHNAKFDMHMLAQEGIELKGDIWCTKTQGRVLYNEHLDYSLSGSLKRIGLFKRDSVEKWITDNHAWEWETIPGKTQRKKNKFFYKVPFDIIAPYALDDAKGCFALGIIQQQDIASESKKYPSNVPTMLNASAIERRLTRTVFNMERLGVKIDRPYCVRAAQYEAGRHDKASDAFNRETGRDYVASSKLFKILFQSEKDKWVWGEETATGQINPSFDSAALKKFENPAAKLILTMRDAKSRMDFYNGFLWHADKNDIIHPSLNQDGTRTYRFSSSEPNLQNLTAEEDEELEQEFVVRRAIIPREGFIFGVIDFKSMEYAMMLDYAKSMCISGSKAKGLTWEDSYFEIANKVATGLDIHQETAKLMGVPRGHAKTLNFMLLYGGGAQKLADALKLCLPDAQDLKAKYFRTLPYVQSMMSDVIAAIKTRGWLRSWAGYKFNFPDKNFAYTGPNTIIQGGCAGVIKKAMNAIDDYLSPYKSKMILCVHDELVIELALGEENLLPKISAIAEKVYPSKHVPLKCSMYISPKSYADLTEYNGPETRD